MLNYSFQRIAHLLYRESGFLWVEETFLDFDLKVKLSSDWGGFCNSECLTLWFAQIN